MKEIDIIEKKSINPSYIQKEKPIVKKELSKEKELEMINTIERMLSEKLIESEEYKLKIQNIKKLTENKNNFNEKNLHINKEKHLSDSNFNEVIEIYYNESKQNKIFEQELKSFHSNDFFEHKPISLSKKAMIKNNNLKSISNFELLDTIPKKKGNLEKPARNLQNLFFDRLLDNNE